MATVNELKEVNPSGKTMNCACCGKAVKGQKQWTAIQLPDGTLKTGYNMGEDYQFPEGSKGVIMGDTCHLKLYNKEFKK